MPKFSAKLVLSNGAEHVLSEIRSGAKLVTRALPGDDLGPHVLLRNGAPQERVSETTLRELLNSKQITTSEPCVEMRCYDIVPAHRARPTIAVRQTAQPPSRTANIERPKKPRRDL